MGRYTRKGLSKIYFVPSLASTTSPSIAEITAGTNLGAAVSDISGFTFSNDPISTPDLASTFVPTIPGEDSSDNPSMTFYEDDTVTTLKTALAKGNDGFIVLMPVGATATKPAEVWPVTSTGTNSNWSVGNDAATFTTQFAVTAAPNQTATLAA
jgi:hypothetical protein